MFAFVPAPALPLASSTSSFVAGTKPSVNEGAVMVSGPTMMADDKNKFNLPSFKMPSMPSMPSIPNLGKKSSSAPAPAPTPTPSPNATPKKAVTLKVQKASDDLASTAYPTLGAKKVQPTTAFRSYPKEYQFVVNNAGDNGTCYDMRVIAPTYFYTADKQGSKNVTFNDMGVYTDDSFWEHPGGWPREQANIAIDRVLKQLFGTTKLFKSDLKELTTSIICVKQTANVKEFVREVGLSDLYKRKFFEPMSNLRFVELNHKHFLGRAPRDQKEIQKHIDIVTSQGYDAEINSYVDSEEYETLYGLSRIPSVNFESRFPYNQGLVKQAVINGAYAVPDTLAKTAFFTNVNYAQFPAFSVQKGFPSGWKSEKKAKEEALSQAQSERVGATDSDGTGTVSAAELAWKMKFGAWQTYWYKDSEMYKQLSEPVLTHPDAEVEEAQAILKYGSTVAKMYMTKE